MTLSQLYSVTPQVNEVLFPNGEYNRTNTRTLLVHSLLYTVAIVHSFESLCFQGFVLLNFPLIAAADQNVLHSFLTGISVIQEAAVCWLCDCVFAHWVEAALSLSDFVHLYCTSCLHLIL